MLTAVETLAHLKEHGYTIALEGGRLKVRGPAAPPPALERAIKENRDALKQHLHERRRAAHKDTQQRYDELVKQGMRSINETAFERCEHGTLGKCVSCRGGCSPNPHDHPLDCGCIHCTSPRRSYAKPCKGSGSA